MRETTQEVVAVILAGGLGTRIKHLLADRPKPMVPVAGRPFLEWLVLYLRRQGIRKIIISTGYRAEIFDDYFGAHPIEGVSIRCIREEKPLGTGGGFLYAAEASREAPRFWLILNGDTLAFADLKKGVDLLGQGGLDGVIYGREVSDTSRYGSLINDESGNLTAYAEKAPGRGLVSTGVSILQDSLLARFPKQFPLSIEKDAYPALIAAGARLRVTRVETPFLDIGTPETLAQGNDFISSNRSQFERDPI